MKPEAVRGKGRGREGSSRTRNAAGSMEREREPAFEASPPAALPPGRASELCAPGAQGPGALSGPESYQDRQSSRRLSVGDGGATPGAKRSWQRGCAVEGSLCSQTALGSSPGFSTCCLDVLECIHVSDPHCPRLSPEDKCHGRGVPRLQRSRDVTVLRHLTPCLARVKHLIDK